MNTALRLLALALLLAGDDDFLTTCVTVGNAFPLVSSTRVIPAVLDAKALLALPYGATVASMLLHGARPLVIALVLRDGYGVGVAQALPTVKAADALLRV